MTVSPGNLDSLLNQSFPVADYQGVSLQTETGAAGSLTASGLTFTYSTVNLNITGVPGPPAEAGEVFTIVGINDTDNSITASLSINGEQISFTDYVVGYSSEGLLLGVTPTTLNAFAEMLAGTSANSPISGLDVYLAVLSSASIPAQTNITFTPSGSYTLLIGP